MKTLKWGFIGSGNVASDFANDMQYAPGNKIVGVYSRNAANRNSFKERFSVTKAYESAETLLSDNSIDIIYISTPHSDHYKYVKQALENNKHVLCEKPCVLSYEQAVELYDFAQKKKLFLMEAMWTCFFPSYHKIKSIIDSGEIGKLEALTANFGFKPEYSPSSRLFNKELAGGALYDVGIYPVMLAYDLFGYPDNIKVLIDRGPTGVDHTTSMLFGYEECFATLNASLVTNMRNEAHIYGSKGYIKIQHNWWQPESFTLYKDNTHEQIFDYELQSKGYNYEIEHINQCINEGLLESPIYSFRKTMDIIKIIENILDNN